MQEFSGKVAVVTGAASGIGRALAQRFAAAGMRLVLADVEHGSLEATAQSVAELGADALALRTDVSERDEVEALAEATYERYGAAHVLCNNAGVGVFQRCLWEQPLEDFEWVLSVNLWGVLHGVRAFVPRMLAGGEAGHIVNTCSMSGLTSMAGSSAYQMSKHGAVTLTETLALELAQREAPIGVSALCPGYVLTQITGAERNRPAHLTANALSGSEGSAALSDDQMKALQEIALEPAEVAQRVFEAIRDNRFWVLTHANANARIEARFGAILRRENPS